MTANILVDALRSWVLDDSHFAGAAERVRSGPGALSDEDLAQELATYRQMLAARNAQPRDRAPTRIQPEIEGEETTAMCALSVTLLAYRAGEIVCARARWEMEFGR